MNWKIVEKKLDRIRRNRYKREDVRRKNGGNLFFNIDSSANTCIIGDGGPGSGNHGHKGVPGKRGGSAKRYGTAREVDDGPVPSAKEARFKPKTQSTYRNKRDEITARQKLKRKREGKKGLPDCTCDPDTGRKIVYDTGYQVSFQTSISEGSGEGAVSDQDYDALTESLCAQTGSKAYVGVFDDPETSFHCETKKEAMEIAKKYNQHSIFNWYEFNKRPQWTDEDDEYIIVKNPSYDSSKNHVKGE